MKLILFLFGATLFGHDWLIVPGERVGPVTRATSEEQLLRELGPGVVKRRFIPSGEEGFEDATLLYGDDPSRALAIQWRDPVKRIRPEMVTICYGLARGECRWRMENGIGFGSSLKALEEANGKPFTLTGFSFEEAGLIASWMGGRLNRLMEPGRRVLLSVEPQSDAKGDFIPPPSMSELMALMRGTDFSSANPLMQKLNPRVSEMLVELGP